MEKEGFFGKIIELKDKFKAFLQHRKQVAALDNYSFIKTFNSNESTIFSSIKFCMKNDFLEEEDASWLQVKLGKLEINYLDWCHRTRWVKDKMRVQTVPQKPKPLQMGFTFPDASYHNIPLHILNGIPKQPGARVQ